MGDGGSRPCPSLNLASGYFLVSVQRTSYRHHIIECDWEEERVETSSSPWVAHQPILVPCGGRPPLAALSIVLFCAIGGQDAYGSYCGTGSLLSAVKRIIWVCGLGTCLPAPGPVHQLIDRRILAFLRDKFNPLRHTEISSKLPPPRRFRVNENFVTYGGDKKDKDLGIIGPSGGQ